MVLDCMLQHSVARNSRLLRAVTGLSRDEFHRLLPNFSLAYSEALAREQGNRPRRRRVGGGRKGQLPSMADKLLFMLVYVHLYPIQEVLGVHLVSANPRRATGRFVCCPCYSKP